MLVPMAKLPKAGLPKVSKSLAGRAMGRFLRFGMLRGIRSVEIDPEDFRRNLAEKHGLWVPHFGRMRDVPVEKLDAIANRLIHDAQRLAMAQGAGFGLGGMITVIPDTGLLTIITLRLIQKLCLLYGFEENGAERRVQMWIAAAAAAGVDLGKDFAEKQMIEKLAPRIAGRLAVRIGEESAEKWVARIIPLASSALGGALNYSFVRTWGRRVHRHLREKHVAERASAPIDITALRPAIVHHG
jgi:EcsC protein family